MKLLLINPVCGILSTGRVCAAIAEEYEAKGWEVKIAYGRRGYVPEKYRKYAVRIGNMLGVYLHALNSMIWGDHAVGLCSKFATQKFIKWAEEFRPDVVWLHNLHDNYINVEVLFAWLKSHPEIEIRWTHHDGWAFAGACACLPEPDFCEQWKSACIHCPKGMGLKRRGWFGGSERRQFLRKKKAFLGVKNMVMYSPSRWLAGLIKQGFLGQYEVKVLPNTIDKTIFKPTQSDFRSRYNLLDKKIVLGVAGFWGPMKGFDDFIMLDQLLAGRVKIVMIGVGKQQMKLLPKSILAIERLHDAVELAGIYTTADVFFNPTKYDNYPTVNMEARACGCPVITYDTGGSAEPVEGYEKAIVLRGEEKTPEGCLRALKVLGII